MDKSSQLMSFASVTLWFVALASIPVSFAMRLPVFYGEVAAFAAFVSLLFMRLTGKSAHQRISEMYDEKNSIED